MHIKSVQHVTVTYIKQNSEQLFNKTKQKTNLKLIDMSTSASSTASRRRIRYTLDVHFATQEEKEAFLLRLKVVRERLSPAGCPPMDNHGLLSAMFDGVEESTSQSVQTDEAINSSSFLGNSGEFELSVK